MRAAEVRDYLGRDRRAFGRVERLSNGNMDVIRRLARDVAVDGLTRVDVAVVGLKNEADERHP